MRIISWNIQAGLGVDGVTDLERIAGVVRALGDADVICLQEVARHLPGADGADSGDQPALFAALFPGFSVCFGAAIDRLGTNGRRACFGNLVLSRLPLLQCFRHPLPQPADARVKHMPRQATEVVVDAPDGALRVVTTHLEFHSRDQRIAQSRRLLELQREVEQAQRQPAAAPPDGPYAAVARPASTVLCGDFNFEPDSREYRVLSGDDDAPYADAWPLAHLARAHAFTCGIHDRVQWPQGPHCRDFFFCSADIAARVHEVRVDERSDASDHQPLLLHLRAV